MVPLPLKPNMGLLNKRTHPAGVDSDGRTETDLRRLPTDLSGSGGALSHATWSAVGRFCFG